VLFSFSLMERGRDLPSQQTDQARTAFFSLSLGERVGVRGV